MTNDYLLFLTIQFLFSLRIAHGPKTFHKEDIKLYVIRVIKWLWWDPAATTDIHTYNTITIIH